METKKMSIYARFSMAVTLTFCIVTLYAVHPGLELVIPNDPSNLSLTGITVNSMDLTWQDNSTDELGFIIQRATSFFGPYSDIHTTTPDETTYTDTGLDPGTRYYYRVRAYDITGTSGYTAANAWTLTGIPDAPSGLSLGGITTSSINLTWVDNSDDETGFLIERRTSSTSFAQVGATGAGITTYNDTGLEDDTEYFYQVRATNSYGESGYSNVASATTDLAVPDAPTGLNLSGETTSSIDLSWSDNSDNETGFLIERRTGATTFAQIGSTGADVNTYTDTGLEDNTTYYYQVRATNGAGESGYSNIASTTTDLAPPAAPDNLVLSNVTSSSIDLTWDDLSDNEDEFLIERRTSISSFSQVATTGTDVNTYTDTGLEEDTRYFYRVRASNTAGESGYSNTESEITLLSPPLAPTGLSVSNPTVSTLDLAWTDNSTNESGFLIERRTASTSWAQVGSTAPDIDTYTDIGLEDNTTYYYRVRATNDAGESDYSNEANGTTLLAVPDAPTLLEGAATTVCGVELKWQDNADNEEGFVIERSASFGSGYAVLDQVEADITTYTDLTTVNNETYYYRINAFNAAGSSVYSNVAMVPVDIVLDGGEIGDDQSICPEGDPELLINISSPSGGDGIWSYQWQSSTLTGTFTDIPGADQPTYNPPAGILETMVYQRVSTAACGSAISNTVTITVEDIEPPIFTTCPNDTVVQIERNEISGVVETRDPVTLDNCGIVSQTWTLTGATTASSPSTGIHVVGDYVFNLGTTTVTYRAEDIGGNIVLCAYDVVIELKDPEILSVGIPNITMKIGDVISATITVGEDGGTPYSLLTGTIGGYPLTNLVRINSTSYLANFTIVEGGNSYAANQNIPVGNLVLTDGITPSLPYNVPISQGNDLLDATLPVIQSMTTQTGIYSIGETVSITVRADGLGYVLHPTSRINGIALTTLPPNVTFTELGSGYYRLSYEVQEGDNDTQPGEFEARVALIEPSGNVSLPDSSIINAELVTIDAHPPVITRLEIPSLEVGVGGIVQVTISADGEEYAVAAGTIINGIPLSSSRVTSSEISGGLYELSYVVDVNDSDVAPGELEMTLVMTDLAGNASLPFSIIDPNELEVYTELPVALLVGPPEICEDDDALMTVYLSGRPPWSIAVSDGSSTQTFDEIISTNYQFTVTPEQNTNYRILTVMDVNGTLNAGDAEGVTVVVNPKTDVNIINLATGYSVEADPVLLEADVPGGVFSGPGVFPTTGYFDPAIADTINSPHTIYYTYENTNGCESVDSAMVFVLGANGVLYIPDELVCQDSEPFEVTASNVAGVIGSFTLYNSNEQAVPGLTDNGDNTANVDPSLLSPDAYVIEYEYFDMVNLYLRTPFLMEVVEEPLITAPEEEIYCQNDPVVDLVSNENSAVFSGEGVVQNGIDGYAFDPRQASPGTHIITCTVTSVNGCSNSAEKEVTVRFAPEVMFSLSEACMPLEGGTIAFTNQTSDKAQVESWNWDFGDPESGDENQSTLADPTHFYQEPGERVIELTATTSEGCVASYTLDTIFGLTPDADFTLMSNCYTNSSEIHFLNRSLNGSVASDTLIWTFRNSSGTLLDQVGSDAQDTVSYDFGSAADYQVDLYVGSPGGCADTVSKGISLKPTIQLVDGQYEEQFNDSEGMWSINSDDQVESWAWSEPDFNGFTADPGDKAWFTQLPVNTIGYLENSWIESPCLDLSSLRRPFIRMDLMRSFVPVADGAVLQYMDNYEEGWKTVGALESGVQWYNTDTITHRPGGGNLGWGMTVFNPDSEWVTAANDLEPVAGKRAVSLRVAVATGGRQAIGNQGFAFDNVFIAERSHRSVLEYFTNSSEPTAVSVDDYVDGIASDQYASMIDLQYHVAYPGFDPMNDANPEPASVRVFNYGIPSIPYAVLNGGLETNHRYGFVDGNEDLEKDLLAQSLQVAPFDIDLTVNWMENSLEATTTVTCGVDRYDGQILLYVVVFESSVDAYTGGNGDTQFRNVVLDMLPNTSGRVLGDGWTPGEEDTQTDTWTYASYVENPEDLGIVAFIVDRNSGSVLHANVKYADSSVPTSLERPAVTSLQLYPNPAKEVLYLNLGTATVEEGHIKLIDMSGRVVLNELLPAGYQIYKLDVANLDRGVYVVQWEQSGMIQGLDKLIKTE